MEEETRQYEISGSNYEDFHIRQKLMVFNHLIACTLSQNQPKSYEIVFVAISYEILPKSPDYFPPLAKASCLNLSLKHSNIWPEF